MSTLKKALAKKIDSRGFQYKESPLARLVPGLSSVLRPAHSLLIGIVFEGILDFEVRIMEVLEASPRKRVQEAALAAGAVYRSPRYRKFLQKVIGETCPFPIFPGELLDFARRFVSLCMEGGMIGREEATKDLLVRKGYSEVLAAALMREAFAREGLSLSSFGMDESLN